jgi:hypothetical protein
MLSIIFSKPTLLTTNIYFTIRHEFFHKTVQRRLSMLPLLLMVLIGIPEFSQQIVGEVGAVALLISLRELFSPHSQL